MYQRIANPTVGANHQRKRVVVDENEVDLFIWDTAGQEQFQSLTPLYARSACVAIMTASIVDQDSFENLTQWIEILSSATEEVPPVVLAINKCDLRENARLTDEKIETTYASKFAGHFFVSALSGEGIDNLFMFAAQVGYRFAMANRNSADNVLNDGGDRRGGCWC
jgi:small GTP-binding protein